MSAINVAPKDCRAFVRRSGDEQDRLRAGLPHDQDPQVWLDALQRAGSERVFIDHRASARFARRPEFDGALDYLRRGDKLVIAKLDHIGRSVRHLIELAGRLVARDIDLVGVHQAIDSTSPGGRRPKVNPRQLALARQLYDSREHTVQAIAETFAVGRSTIYRSVTPAGVITGAGPDLGQP